MTPKKKTVAEAVAGNHPWMPPAYNVADAVAIQALMTGKADANQQQRALKWIIEVCSGTYDQSYRPGAQEGERDTTFALGRQFVGQQIVKLTRLNVSKLRSDENVSS